MELKLNTFVYAFQPARAFNRTIVELKLSLLILFVSQDYSFNRTIVELKLDIGAEITLIGAF